MSFFYTCPDCGANLDPGEKCDCQDNDDKTTNLLKEDNENVRNESNDHSRHRSCGSNQ